MSVATPHRHAESLVQGLCANLQRLSNPLGILFSLLLHGVGLAWFLSESPAPPGQDAPSLIEVSFVRSLPEIPSSSSSRKSSKRIEGDYPGSTSNPHYRSRISASKPTKKTRPTNAKSTSPHHYSEPVWLPTPGSGSLKKAETHPQGKSPEKAPPLYHAGSRQNPLPTYPYVSRRRGEEGKVTCTVTVNPEGQPQTIEIKESSGYERLDAAAKTVLSSWVFKPAEKDSQKIYGFVVISITFHLTEDIKI